MTEGEKNLGLGLMSHKNNKIEAHLLHFSSLTYDREKKTKDWD